MTLATAAPRMANCLPSHGLRDIPPTRRGCHLQWMLSGQQRDAGADPDKEVMSTMHAMLSWPRRSATVPKFGDRAALRREEQDALLHYPQASAAAVQEAWL